MNDSHGLRERKKTETRVAIHQAVLFLALGRGLEAVTADEIAAAANVSVRTFHNYFGSKEEALVAAWVSEFEVYVDALRDRPADEPILDALEHVFGEIASRIEEHAGVRGGRRPRAPAPPDVRAPPVRAEASAAAARLIATLPLFPFT